MTDLADRIEREGEVYLLIRCTGSYDDYRETPLGYFTDKGDALAQANRARDEWLAANEANPPVGCYGQGEDDDPSWSRWEAEALAQATAFKDMLTVDPGAAPQDGWGWCDEPSYSVWTIVPFQQQQSERG